MRLGVGVYLSKSVDIILLRRSQFPTRFTFFHFDKQFLTLGSLLNISYATVLYCTVLAGPHNLRSFLAENSTQTYFLIAHMFSFCDICDKNAVFNILRQNLTNFDIGNG